MIDFFHSSRILGDNTFCVVTDTYDNSLNNKIIGIHERQAREYYHLDGSCSSTIVSYQEVLGLAVFYCQF